jgi:hypothetical protein
VIARVAPFGWVTGFGGGNGNLDGSGTYRYINEYRIVLEIGLVASVFGAAQDLNHHETEE